MTTTSLRASSQRPEPSPITQLIAASTSGQAASPLALPLEILHNLRHQHSWTDLTLHYIPSSSSPRTLQTLPLPLSSLPPSVTNTSAASTTPILISGQPPRPVYIHPDEQTAALKAKPNTNTITEDPASNGDGASNAAKSTPTVAPPAPREYVLPLSLAVTPSVAFLSGVFDTLPLPATSSPLPSTSTSSASASSVSASSAPASSSSEVPTLSLSATTTTQQKRPSSPHVPSSAETPPATNTTTTAAITNGTNPKDAGAASSTDGPGDGSGARPGPGNGIRGKRVLLAIKGPDGTVAYYVCLEGQVKPRQNG